jgi:hypothetical protein
MESRTTRRALLKAAPAAAANTDNATTIISTLHRRYEQTMAEYLVIEAAEDAAEDEIEKAGFRRACQDSVRETEAIRMAILYQVPTDLTDAAILQFHVTCAYDMAINCEDQPEAEREALTIAIDTLFDFLCGELQVDHQQVGPSFKYGATRALRQRRHRTGQVEA